jgi:hypothetical protein
VRFGEPPFNEALFAIVCNEFLSLSLLILLLTTFLWSNFANKDNLKMKKLISAAFVTSLLLAGCVTAPGPGTHEGAIPPKLVMKDKAKTWDNAGNFGPVPVAMAAKGAATCATLSTNDAKYIATGYHSKALDVDGKPFMGGGYYCVRQ